MKITKERQFLLLDDDKKITKFNLVSARFEDEEYNAVLDCYLERSEDLFEDKNMFYMLHDIGNKEEYCDTIGEILNCFYNYKNFEQIYSAGLRVFLNKYSEYGMTADFDYTINEIPKGLRKICKENNYYLDTKMVRTYLANPDIYNQVYFIKNEYKGLKKTNLKKICEWKFGNRGRRLFLVYLHDILGYKIKDLMLYFDYLKTEIKMRNVDNMLSQYAEYVSVCVKSGEDFEKYPKNFIEKYDEVCEEQKRQIEQKRIEKYNKKREKENDFFSKKIKYEYEIEYEDYVFIYPKSAEEIRKEGKNQHNCVATYIDRVVNGHCDILFLRKKKEPNKSLVTLEVRKGSIVQARRVCNSNVTEEDRKAIDYFNNRFGNGKKYEDCEDDFEYLED